MHYCCCLLQDYEEPVQIMWPAIGIMNRAPNGMRGEAALTDKRFVKLQPTSRPRKPQQAAAPKAQQQQQQAAAPKALQQAKQQEAGADQLCRACEGWKGQLKNVLECD